MYATDFPEIAAGSDFDPTTPPPHSRFIPRAHKTPRFETREDFVSHQSEDNNNQWQFMHQPTASQRCSDNVSTNSHLKPCFFQCANGVIADVVVLVIFTPFVVDFAADNVSGFVV